MSFSNYQTLSKLLGIRRSDVRFSKVSKQSLPGSAEFFYVFCFITVEFVTYAASGISADALTAKANAFERAVTRAFVSRFGPGPGVSVGCSPALVTARRQATRGASAALELLGMCENSLEPFFSWRTKDRLEIQWFRWKSIAMSGYSVLGLALKEQSPDSILFGVHHSGARPSQAEATSHEIFAVEYHRIFGHPLNRSRTQILTQRPNGKPPLLKALFSQEVRSLSKSILKDHKTVRTFQISDELLNESGLHLFFSIPGGSSRNGPSLKFSSWKAFAELSPTLIFR